MMEGEQRLQATTNEGVLPVGARRRDERARMGGGGGMCAYGTKATV